MKATVNGVVVEGTVAEIRSLLFGNNGEGAEDTTESSPSVWNEKLAREFWESLDPENDGGNQKLLLRLLIARGQNGASWEEAYKSIGAGLKEGLKFAGTRANITRNARRVTGKKVEVVLWKRTGKNKGYYYIPSDLCALLAKVSESDSAF